MKLYVLAAGIAAIVALSAGGCATISEDQCLAGNWADIGYKDGANGKSRGRLADYADTCNKYGALPNRTVYLRNYEQGLDSYCTYERGFSRGEHGNDYNQVCSGALAEGFAEGYDAGRVIYEIRREHKQLVERYEDTVDAVINVRTRLENDELDDEERKRLRKKLHRLKDRREDIRIDIRAHERVHGLSRYDFH
jgi:hypothetical protein